MVSWLCALFGQNSPSSMELATSQPPLLPGTSSTYRDLNAPLVLAESSCSQLALRKKTPVQWRDWAEVPLLQPPLCSSVGSMRTALASPGD